MVHGQNSADHDRRVRPRNSVNDDPDADAIIHGGGIKPNLVSEAMVAHARQHPEEPGLRALLEYILSYCRGKNGFPMNATMFIKDPASYNFWVEALRDYAPRYWAALGEDGMETDGAELYTVSKGSLVNLKEEGMSDDYVHFVCGEVRSRDVIALEELHGGMIKQGAHESVATYVQRFMVRVRALPKESQATFCMFFRKGLHSHALREKVTLDDNNNPWKKLTDLIQYTYGWEIRLNLNPIGKSAPPPPKGRYAGNGRDWKSMSSAYRGSGRLAVAQGWDDEEDGGAVAAMEAPKLQFEKNMEAYGDEPGAPPRNPVYFGSKLHLPVSECLLFAGKLEASGRPVVNWRHNNPIDGSRPYKLREQDDAAEHDLCQYCLRGRYDVRQKKCSNGSCGPPQKVGAKRKPSDQGNGWSQAGGHRGGRKGNVGGPANNGNRGYNGNGSGSRGRNGGNK